MKIQLSGDNWAELRDADTLTNGQRKPIMRAIGALPLTKDGTPDLSAVDADQIMRIGDVMLCSFLVSWSFGDLPDKDDPDAFDDLLADDYDKLQLEAGKLLPGVASGGSENGTDPPKPSAS